MKTTIIVNLQLTAIENPNTDKLMESIEEFAKTLASESKTIFALDDVTILATKVFTHEEENNDSEN